MKIDVKLKPGNELLALEPILGITGTGRYTYLWIGNDSPINKACYATLSGQKTLEKLAIDILKAIRSNKI